MERLPLVVSFFTKDTPYEEEVQSLIESCKKFSIEHEIEGIPSSGSWEMNCAFKPLFLLKKLEECKRPLLWVDADAVFLGPIEHLDQFSLDLAVRLYDCPDDHPSRVVTSTLYINETSGAKKTLKLWAESCLSHLRQKDRKEEIWDQDVLRKILLSKGHELEWGGLPDQYSVIAGHPEDEKIKTPLIVQNQASRRFKKWINHSKEKGFF